MIHKWFIQGANDNNNIKPLAGKYKLFKGKTKFLPNPQHTK